MAKLKVNAELKDFLAKLDKIKFNEVLGRNEIKGDVFGTEAVLNMSTKLNENGIMAMSHQTIFHLSIGGAYIQTWGSESDESNTEMVKYFFGKKRDAQWVMDLENDTNAELMKALFDAL